jgi:hypothetical protein
MLRKVHIGILLILFTVCGRVAGQSVEDSLRRELEILKLRYKTAKQALEKSQEIQENNSPQLDNALQSFNPAFQNCLAIQILPIFFGGNEFKYLRFFRKAYAVAINAGFYKIQEPPYLRGGSYFEAFRIEAGLRKYNKSVEGVYSQLLVGYKQAYLRGKDIRIDENGNEIITKSWANAVYGLIGSGYHYPLFKYVYVDVFAGLGINLLLDEQNIRNINFGTLYPLNDQAFVRLGVALGVYF